MGVIFNGRPWGAAYVCRILYYKFNTMYLPSSSICTIHFTRLEYGPTPKLLVQYLGAILKPVTVVLVSLLPILLLILPSKWNSQQWTKTDQ